MIKKLLSTITILLMFCSSSWATSVTVCDSGCDYTTIHGALTALGNGNHTITVTGTYTKESTFSVTESGTDPGYLLITTSGTHYLPHITLSGNYIKVNGFTFFDTQVTSSGSYNVINGCNFRHTKAAATGAIRTAVISGAYNSFTNNLTKNQHYSGLWLQVASSYATVSGNTFTENCSGQDTILLFGDGHLIKDNIFSYLSLNGRKWEASETLEVGQCRAAEVPTQEGVLYWVVTTAGMTGGTVPDGFDLTGKSAENTVSDGGVTWTAKACQPQHPDIMQTYNQPNSNDTSKNHIIDGNICVDHCTIDDSLQLGAIEQKHCADIKDWTYRNNIFRVSRVLNVFAPGFKFYNNTFLGPMTQQSGPISLSGAITHGYGNAAIVKNNVAVGLWDASSIVCLYPTPTALAPNSTARVNNTAYSLNDRIYTATPDGFHIWKCTQAGTSDSSEPAGYTSINIAITADTALNSATISNVSTFTGYDATHTGSAPHYYLVDWTNHIGYMAHVHAVDAGAGTITLGYYNAPSTDDPYISSIVGSTVPMTVTPDCDTKTIVVTDGTAKFTCMNGVYGTQASNNYYAKGPGSSYGSISGCVGIEASSVDGGNPQFVNFSGTTANDFKFASNSVLKDVGADLSGVWASALDKFGTSRPQGAAWDIGAYEYQYTGGTTLGSGGTLSIGAGGTITFGP